MTGELENPESVTPGGQDGRHRVDLMVYDRLDDPAWSEFHDLMHTPFSRYCRLLPGGPLRHLRLWMQYGGPVIWPPVDCPRGIHNWATGQVFDLPPGEFCLTCLTWRPLE